MPIGVISGEVDDLKHSVLKAGIGQSLDKGGGVTEEGTGQQGRIRVRQPAVQIGLDAHLEPEDLSLRIGSLFPEPGQKRCNGFIPVLSGAQVAKSPPVQVGEGGENGPAIRIEFLRREIVVGHQLVPGDIDLSGVI